MSLWLCFLLDMSPLKPSTCFIYICRRHEKRMTNNRSTIIYPYRQLFTCKALYFFNLYFEWLFSFLCDLLVCRTTTIIPLSTHFFCIALLSFWSLYLQHPDHPFSWCIEGGLECKCVSIVLYAIDSILLFVNMDQGSCKCKLHVLQSKVNKCIKAKLDIETSWKY